MILVFPPGALMFDEPARPVALHQEFPPQPTNPAAPRSLAVDAWFYNGYVFVGLDNGLDTMVFG